MSGHSKWKNIMHKKEKTDAQRAKVFTKIGKEIAIAVKEGGPDPISNGKLRDLIAKAKSNNVPNDNIDRIIKKATGADAVEYEEITYEGYGPAGIGVYVECLTDNRNRTAADVRSAFSHSGGNLGANGSVAYMFDRKGQITVLKEVETGDKKNPTAPNGAAADSDEFEMAVIEAGADDYEEADDEWVVYTEPSDLMAVRSALEEQGIEVKGAELIFEPNNPTAVSIADAKKVQRLIDKLEEFDDVQNVYSTMDITDEVAAALDED